MEEALVSKVETELETLDLYKVWIGKYRSIIFEVKNWDRGWNYYLTISIDQIPEDFRKFFNLRGKKSSLGFTWYAYESDPILSELEWHGGITFYSGRPVSFKLGCDYMHFWDEGQIYTLEGVLEEVKASIDTLWELVPTLKVRCSYDGKYYPLEETHRRKGGDRVALVNKEKME